MTEIKGITPETQKYLSECQYRCYKGKIYLASTKSMEDCPHCSDIYKKIAQGESEDETGRDIYKILCIPSRYKNLDADIDMIFPPSILDTTSIQSRNEIIEELKNITNIVHRGNKIDNDYLFYMGVETDILPYVFSLLRRGYSQGFEVVPYINTLELIQLFKLEEEPLDSGCKVGEELKKELGVGYMDYCRAELCIVSLTPSSGRSSINMLFSLLKSRRSRGLYTIVFSETQGTSRELGYIINSEDFIKRFIDQREKQEKREYKQVVKEAQQVELTLEHFETNLGVASEENLMTSRKDKIDSLRNKF